MLEFAEIVGFLIAFAGVVALIRRLGFPGADAPP